MPPNGDKIDIYDFGVILLEVVTGRPITSIHEVEVMKEQVGDRSPPPHIDALHSFRWSMHPSTAARSILYSIA